MNCVRTGERITALLAGYRRVDSAPGIPGLEDMASAPLLVRPQAARMQDGAIEAVRAGSEWAWANGTPKLPFPVVRFSSALVLPRSGNVECVGVIWRNGGDIACLADFGSFCVGVASFGPVCPITKKSNCVGYELGSGRMKRNMEVAGFLVVVALDLLWHFAHPSFQPVLVAPEQSLSAGRSVEWKRAREFYTVVHRRSGGGGSRVAPHRRSAVMTAHARRAHERVLRSEKWGASRGRVVWVRSAWVGPKEWQDAESRQVYRVVDFPSQ